MEPGSGSAQAFPLSPRQVQSIVESESARISCWTGAVRSGKTFASLIAFLAAVAEAPPSGLILISGRTLQTIERNILNPLQDPALFGSLASSVAHTRGAGTATILGREVHLIGAADARAEGKLRGLTACLALVDEATLIPEEFWTQLLARLSVPGARLLATTNPGGPFHWLKAKFLDRASELDLASWHFVLDDNPSLDPDYKAAIKAEHTGLFYQRNVLGAWVAAEGAVYDSWDPARHVIPHDRLPVMRRILAAGVDHGMTNASAGVLLGLGVDGRLYAIDEWRTTNTQGIAGMSVADQVRSLRSWLSTNPPPEWVIVDPAAAAMRTELWQQGQTNVMDADNAVVYGIATVSSLLSSGHLVVSDRCRWLQQEFPSYVWDPKATEKGDDRPRKTADHQLDGLRYAVATTESVWRSLLATPALEVAA